MLLPDDARVGAAQIGPLRGAGAIGREEVEADGVDRPAALACRTPVAPVTTVTTASTGTVWVRSADASSFDVMRCRTGPRRFGDLLRHLCGWRGVRLPIVHCTRRVAMRPPWSGQQGLFRKQRTVAQRSGHTCIFTAVLPCGCPPVLAAVQPSSLPLPCPACIATMCQQERAALFNVIALCVSDLIHCTNEPNVSIPQLANLLIERSQNANWVVVYKALITVHHMMCYGNEVRSSVAGEELFQSWQNFAMSLTSPFSSFQRFTQYLASSNSTFQLSNFLDKSGVQGLYQMCNFSFKWKGIGGCK